jgi:hypothetical protein
MTVAARSQPEFVIAPARPRAAGGSRDVVFEMRRQPDGRIALPVFSSVAELLDALGDYQPWVCLPLRSVLAVAGPSAAVEVVIDPAVDAAAWRRREASLAEFDPDGQLLAWSR